MVLGTARSDPFAQSRLRENFLDRAKGIGLLLQRRLLWSSLRTLMSNLSPPKTPLTIPPYGPLL